MRGVDHDDAILCALALAEAGAVSTDELMAWIDGEVVRRDDPPSWLLAAALAGSPEDRLHWLRQGAGTAPGQHDGLLYLVAAVEAFRRGRVSSEDLARRALHAAWDYDLPEPVDHAIWELDEAALCAHDSDGVPQPARVQEAAAALQAAVAAHAGARGRVIAHVLSAAGIPPVPLE